MEKLNYKVLEKSGYHGYILKNAPEKVLQFGEGNFLRAFVDHWFDIANEKANFNGKCIIVKPRSNASPICNRLNDQEGLYTLHLRGIEKGEKIDRKRVISFISRCINPYTDDGFSAMMEAAVSDDLEYVVSNTTEAGIVYDPVCRLEDKPASSFPGKLTQILYARFQAAKPGLVILPCELNDDNGTMLRNCVNHYAKQWGLGEKFTNYVNEKCLFCNTLVDRIVPGAIMDEGEIARLEMQNGYSDSLAVVSEVFGVWNIEGPAWLEDKLPFNAAGVNCSVVPHVTPYKMRKVRILNGAHTGFVPGAYLAGFDIVRDCMEDDTIRGYMNKLLYDEVIPTLPLERNDLECFVAAVEDRFNNPFIDHALMSISLNSTAKWAARNMPALIDYVNQKHELPKCLAMSFAAYIAFYSTNVQELSDKGLVCRRPKGNDYICSDNHWVLKFYWDHRNDSVEELVHSVMTNQRMWGRDLTAISGFQAATIKNLTLIRKQGALAAFASCL